MTAIIFWHKNSRCVFAKSETFVLCTLQIMQTTFNVFKNYPVNAVPVVNHDQIHVYRLFRRFINSLAKEHEARKMDKYFLLIGLKPLLRLL